MRRHSVLASIMLGIVSTSTIADVHTSTSEIDKPVLVEPEKQVPVEPSSNTGVKILGGVAGAVIGVVAAPALVLLSPLAALPVVLMGNNKSSAGMYNAQTVALPDVGQVAEVKFIGRKFPDDWKLNPDLASCPFSGMAVPFTGNDDLQGEINGRAILLNKRVCPDGREERVLLSAVRSEKMIFFNKGTMQAGYSLEFTPLSKDGGAEWLVQVADRLALAAKSDEKVRKFYDELMAPTAEAPVVAQ